MSRALVSGSKVGSIQRNANKGNSIIEMGVGTSCRKVHSKIRQLDIINCINFQNEHRLG